jgi:hypothetical protein
VSAESRATPTVATPTPATPADAPAGPDAPAAASHSANGVEVVLEVEEAVIVVEPGDKK